MLPRAPEKHQRPYHRPLQEKAVQAPPGRMLGPPALVSPLQGNATLRPRSGAANLRPWHGGQTRLPWALLPTHGLVMRCCAQAFFDHSASAERLQTPKRILRNYQPRHHEGLSPSSASTNHALYKPARPQSTCRPRLSPHPPPSVLLAHQ